MELQQNLNLITRILKQTVGLEHICRKILSFMLKGRNKHIFFSDIWRYHNIALNQ